MHRFYLSSTLYSNNSTCIEFTFPIIPLNISPIRLMYHFLFSHQNRDHLSKCSILVNSTPNSSETLKLYKLPAIISLYPYILPQIRFDHQCYASSRFMSRKTLSSSSFQASFLLSFIRLKKFNVSETKLCFIHCQLNTTRLKYIR